MTEWDELFNVKSPVAETYVLIYHCPWGENSSLFSEEFLAGGTGGK